ncbi:helix-turn-helix domain-containing protein [Terrabacter terrigena]|uniref:Helix-turn-helix domain-containing protein n=1 Tax=Terrabacter terrigena TaxID=574718 RepID=A0ABW3MYU0_9MICO
MSTHYVVELELDTKPAEAVVSRALDLLEAYHPAAAESPAGLLEVAITLPADDLRQAVTTALALARPIAGVVAVSALPEAVRDRRQGWDVVDELVGVSQAGEILGVSRQRVLQIINEGKLPNRKVGREYAIPRAAVEALLPRID